MPAQDLLSLERLNAAGAAEFVALLAGVYEHSPWIAEAAAPKRPFASLAQLKRALVEAVRAAGREAQLALVRAHPELAGKAALANRLTAESSSEQSRAGLVDCSAEELDHINRLNADYKLKFGWPFILAVRGPRGIGLTRRQIIASFERRLAGQADFEFAECLRQIHRIAELRLDDKFGVTPELGNRVWDWAEQLARHSDPGYAERGQLTVTYLTDAHRACAAQLLAWMRDDCGFDEVRIDAVGNVVGLYWSEASAAQKNAADSSAAQRNGLEPDAAEGKSVEPGPAQAEAAEPNAAKRVRPSPGQGREREGSGPSTHAVGPANSRRLLTGSHYDTVRNAGKYDGRLGILVPMACVRELHRAGRRLPFDIEVVGFAEEEGQRYKATFLGSGALVGQFDPAWLDQRDADGIAMRDAMLSAGLAVDEIAKLKRDPADYLGFIEVHIEQGPVLNELDLPLGVVTSINGGVRYAGEVIGVASHAGTTPMDHRRDAATAVAELALFLEKRAAAAPNVVGTMGMLAVPNGSTNVIPGRCEFSLDIRATTDPVRDACVADVLDALKAICARRGVGYRLDETMRAAAAPCAPDWQDRWARAVESAGLPAHRMPSGAGHDAMKLHEAMAQAMLFVRGENAGISHNPLESSTSDDIELAVEACARVLDELARELSPSPRR